MRLRSLLLFPIVFLPAHRKEAAAVRVSVSGTENQRFVISVHGLRVLNSTEYFLANRVLAGHLVRQQDTIAAPAVLDMGGLGFVDLAPLDTAAAVTAELQELLDTARTVRSVSGRRVRIDHRS